MRNRIEQKSAVEISNSMHPSASTNAIGTASDAVFFEKTNFAGTLEKAPVKHTLNETPPKYERSETKIEKAFRSIENQAKAEPEPTQNPERSNSRLAKVFSKTQALKSQSKKNNQSTSSKSFAKIDSSILIPKYSGTATLNKNEQKYSIKNNKGILN